MVAMPTSSPRRHCTAEAGTGRYISDMETQIRIRGSLAMSLSFFRTQVILCQFSKLSNKLMKLSRQTEDFWNHFKPVPQSTGLTKVLL